MDELFNSALQSSFSVVVAAFLLLRQEKELRRLSTAIEQLRRCQICKLAPPVPEPAPVQPTNFQGT